MHTFGLTATQATQEPYADAVGSPTALSTSGLKAFVISKTEGDNSKIPSEIRNIIQRDPTARFVVFGLGNRCTMVGTTLQNAPTSVPQNSGFTPATLYSRIGVIFQVNGVGVQATERARFVASAALEDDEIESTEKDIVGYYQVANSGQ